jgi:hypothetical protein
MITQFLGGSKVRRHSVAVDFFHWLVAVGISKAQDVAIVEFHPFDFAQGRLLPQNHKS